MIDRKIMLIDGPNPSSASVAEWEAYARRVEGLIAEGYDLDFELEDAHRWIEKRRREAVERS